jgi:hypothetical protein
VKQRPQNFCIDRRNKLARGLVFAGLGGQSARTLRYTDSSGRSNHGTLTGMDPATDWVWSNKLGQWVLDFAGDDDYVTTGNITRPNTGTMTICAWVNPRLLNGVTGHWILSQRENTTNQQFQLYWYAPNKCFFLDWWDNGGTGRSTTDYGTDETVNTWYHVCGVVNGVSGFLYVNGVLKSGPIANGTMRAPTSLPFVIGKIPHSSSYYWNGQIYDPLVYSRVLSPAEIAILANRSDPSLGGLIQNPRRKYFPVKQSILPFKQYTRLGRLVLSSTF